MEKILTASKKMISLLLIIVAAGAITIMLSADASASMGFSVEPHFPSNQRGNPGYFDLRLTPGQEQDITLTVTNPTDTEIAVMVEAFTVSTARSGSIDYSNARVNDETLAHSISDLLTIPEPRVVIPAGSAKDITLHLSAPSESFGGILLGSLRILREPTEQELEEAGAIVNRFAQAMAIVLSMDDEEIQTDFALGDITSQITNARASVVVDVRNPQPKLVKDVIAQTRIVELASNEEIFSQTLDSVDFAPNSIFPLTFVDRAGHGLRAGSYRAYVTLEHGGQVWELEQDFEITPTQADTVNSAALNQDQQAAPRAETGDGISPVMVVIIAVGAVLLAVAVPVIIRKKRKSDEMVQQMLGRIMEFQKLQQDLDFDCSRLEFEEESEEIS